MIRSLQGRHRKLLFRSYFVLVAGLLTVAAVLDFGFGYLQAKLAPENDYWLDASFALIETRLVQADPADYAAIAEGLSDTLDIKIQLLDREDVASDAAGGSAVESLTDSAGNQYFLRDAPAIGRLIYLGPREVAEDSLVLRLLPPVFYLSIFVLVGLWLSPLLKDLNRITLAAQKFAADYREPLSTAAETTQLTELATHLDDMSGRISGLIQSQKELIAALSHEMRTPLARIRFALAVIGHETNGTDKQLQQRLDELGQDVQEIDQLIATMLSYARLDHPDLQMNTQSVPVASWLGDIEKKIHHPTVTLETHRPPDLDTMQMDPRLMGLALSNLLSNASRHAENEIQCLIAVAGDGYEIEVHDDGRGIPEEERASVFKAFTRLDNSRNRDTGGYGLGLAIVSRIAALHGGSVTVDESSILGGARFAIRWPQDANLPAAS